MRRAPAVVVLGSAVALTIYSLAQADKPPLRFEWKSIDKKYWQIVTPPGEAPEVTDAREGNRGACGAGMVEITGKMRVSYMGDFIQQSTCKNWINKDFPERCAEFDRDKWLALTAKLPQKDMHFCIDRFEYPNRKGEYPLIMVDWNEAEKMCKAQNRRLCNEDEWTFACEGEEAMPYPYGYVRDANACLVDKAWRQWEGSWARGRDRDDTMREVDRLWQGVPSGSLPKCKSVFGVYDLVGNVDEWTRSTSPTGNKSIFKGGYWGPVRTRCRPTTRIHGESHVLYQEGFRCCSDLK
ncbi:MAG: SUMF1/EgtB/PvdO family nonheme iron enzyme [Polyangiaceae bacterium]|nr:SUMF1/EgtB/PvdO family nonheme iron enzyme [Polyangiaceae bacterium]